VACIYVHVGSLLHGNRFAAAEQDCTAALSLDPTYTKTLFRRATARTKLKKHKDAMHGMLQYFIATTLVEYMMTYCLICIYSNVTHLPDVWVL